MGGIFLVLVVGFQSAHMEDGVDLHPGWRVDLVGGIPDSRCDTNRAFIFADQSLVSSSEEPHLLWEKFN